MGTSTGMRSTASALFGKTRLSILVLLFMNEEKSFYLREIIEILNMGSGTVQRELDNLVGAHIITKSPSGNQVHYQANPHSSVFHELKSIIVKTAGVTDLVREALSKLAGKIDFAFIYGSFAAGDFSEKSDIDILIVGRLTFKDAVVALAEPQEKIGREINPTVYSRKTYHKKLRESDHFLSDILSKKILMIAGKEDDVRKPGT